MLAGGAWGQAPAPPATTDAAKPPAAITPPMQPRAAVEALTDLLRSAIGDRDSRRRDRTLTGLRSLRDPEMLALFAQLSINPSPMLRVHGLLGLAELEPQRGLDLLAVSRIPDPRLQGVIIYDALASSLIGNDTLSELSSWSTLPARVRLDVAGACVSRSCPFDVAGVLALLKDPDPFIAVTAAVVLQQAGVEVAASEQTVRTRAQGLAAGRGEAAADLAAFVIEHNLRSASTALTLIAGALKPGPEADAVTAARLVASPADSAVIQAARARLDIAVPAPERKAFAQRMLDAALKLGPQTPAAILSEMTTDPDPLVKAMGTAAASLAGDQTTVGAAVAALARLGDPATVAWSLRCAAERHWQDARAIRMAVIDGIAKRSPGAAVAPQLSEMAALAVTSLCDDDPRSLDRPLAEALSASDGPLTRIILEGVIRSTRDSAGAIVRQGAFAARPTGPWPTNESAALALLVAVRHGEFTADPLERIERLSAIARGEGGGDRLSGVLRAQAAWLALRASGEARVALTRILSDLPTPVADTPGAVQPPPAPPPPPSSAPSPPPVQHP